MESAPIPDSRRDRTTTMVITGLVIVLAVASVALRLYTRISMRQGIKADDWLILAAVIIALLTVSILLWGNIINPRSVWISENTDPSYTYQPQDHVYLQISFATSALYFTVASTSKLGILVTYNRLFASSRAFRNQLWAAGALVSIFWIGCTEAALLACVPLEWAWANSLEDPRYCFNYNLFWAAAGACEVALDVVIVAMPQYLWYAMMMVVLTVGDLSSVIIITGLVRCITGYAPGKRVPSYSNSEVWTLVHGGVSIVCASLPVFYPLFRTVLRRWRSPSPSRLRSGGEGGTEVT
ncbi:hypothetical protein B0T19DRAFT_398691 [Cercophora scortea]|uniref:Rhodopsin domain-containing protein n=1 Tax=Cercophora scortea TaxID=314031 RepID=A0AAE0MHR9_9PEZI|nr:hypothetical protein B0T19DRAFT_398691 [Cercophora scortea]